MSRKKHPEHVNHERWLVSYADFITLLFAFFVVLFAASQTDKNKQMKLAEAMQSAFTPLGTFDAHSKTPPLTRRQRVSYHRRDPSRLSLRHSPPKHRDPGANPGAPHQTTRRTSCRRSHSSWWHDHAHHPRRSRHLLARGRLLPLRFSRSPRRSRPHALHPRHHAARPARSASKATPTTSPSTPHSSPATGSCPPRDPPPSPVFSSSAGPSTPPISPPQATLSFIPSPPTLRKRAHPEPTRRHHRPPPIYAE